jgi:hypothetical protein
MQQDESHPAGPAEDMHGGVSVPAVPSRIALAFYTCGDNGQQFPARLFGGRLHPTDAYKQLAECLASPDQAYPRIGTSEAITNQTFGVREATQVFNNLPARRLVEKVYFIGHGTAAPSAYFFSGRPVADPHDFASDDYNQLFFLTTNYAIGTFENDYASFRDRLNAHQFPTPVPGQPSFRSTFEEWGFPLSGAARVEVRTRNDRWVVVDGNYRYRIQHVPDTDNLEVIGEHTPHLEDCQRLVKAMKSRLTRAAHIKFLSCFTAVDPAPQPPNLITLLQQRIDQTQPDSSGVKDPTVSGYWDYFETGWSRLEQGRILDWHNRIIDVDTDQVVSEASGPCGENIIPQPQFEARPYQPLPPDI